LTLDDVQALRIEFGHRVEVHFPVPRSRSPADAAEADGARLRA
jgi:hypothetical protein